MSAGTLVFVIISSHIRYILGHRQIGGKKLQSKVEMYRSDIKISYLNDYQGYIGQQV